jgi:hypothetical protein
VVLYFQVVWKYFIVASGLLEILVWEGYIFVKILHLIGVPQSEEFTAIFLVGFVLLDIWFSVYCFVDQCLLFWTLYCL